MKNIPLNTYERKLGLLRKRVQVKKNCIGKWGPRQTAFILISEIMHPKLQILLREETKKGCSVFGQENSEPYQKYTSSQTLEYIRDDVIYITVETS